MLSMTGYGRGVCDRDGFRAVVEVRSVNHRFLDLRLRGGFLDGNSEELLTKLVKARLKRGSVTVTAKLRREEAGGTAGIDVAAARRATDSLRELAGELGVSADLSLEFVLSQPGVRVTEEATGESRAWVGVLEEAAAEALGKLVEMRTAEGVALASDLTTRLTTLAEIAGSIESVAKAEPERASERMRERLGKILARAGVEIDSDKLAHEVAVLADKLDITEEVVRIRSHVDQAKQQLDTEGPVGRRLDFLVQELGREFNTIASKSQHIQITAHAVDAKAELERVREQVQNVE